MVGTSLLTMPWGLERSGLAMGMFLVIIMAALCCYTAYCNVATQTAYGEEIIKTNEIQLVSLHNDIGLHLFISLFVRYLSVKKSRAS